MRWFEGMGFAGCFASERNDERLKNPTAGSQTHSLPRDGGQAFITGRCFGRTAVQDAEFATSILSIPS